MSGVAAGRRRFCQALDLIDSPALIAEYQQQHQRIWPGIAAHLREHGILDMEIYRLGTRLFMIVEVSADFDAAGFDAASLNNPEVQRWEALMWHYQAATPGRRRAKMGGNGADIFSATAITPTSSSPDDTRVSPCLLKKCGLRAAGRRRDRQSALGLYPGHQPVLHVGLSYGLLDVLNKHFQETLHVTKAQSGLLQAAYFGAYFLVALPAGYFMDRKGYKAGILVGLCLYALGALLFVPAASANSFGVFLFALFVIASGLGCLETAANPYATVLGDAQGAERRLNLAQSFNGLGQFIGPLIGGTLFFSASQSAGGGGDQSAVKMTYVAIAVLVLLIALLFSRTRLPAIREEENRCMA